MMAQNGIIQEGEFGFGLGASHYFGDLNDQTHLDAPKLAGTIFYRKNFGNYIALRLSGTFTQLGYSDARYTSDPVKMNRNLSFNTKLWEVGLHGDFNFFRFMPGDPYFAFTPYVTLGVSMFNYDPYAFLINPTTGASDKYYLRPLATEGQSSPYSTMAFAIPFGVGAKYSFNEKLNVGFEIVHRFTNTDYLDDVSTVYANPSIFAPGSPAFQLQNRSATPPKPGSQRGNSQTKDQFTTAILYISFNLQSYKCPTAF